MHTGQDLHSPTREQWGGSAVVRYLQEVQIPDWLRAEIFCHHLPNGVNHREREEHPVTSASNEWILWRAVVRDLTAVPLKGKIPLQQERGKGQFYTPCIKVLDLGTGLLCLQYHLFLPMLCFSSPEPKEAVSPFPPLQASLLKIRPSSFFSTSHCRASNTLPMKPISFYK